MRNVILELTKIQKKVLDSDSDVEKIKILLEGISGVINSSKIGIYLNDGSKNSIAEYFSYSNNKFVINRNKTKLDINSGLIGLVANRKHPINLTQFRDHPKYVYNPKLNDKDYKTFIGIPLVRYGALIGVLVVYTGDIIPLIPEDEAFLVTLSSQLSLLIEDVNFPEEINIFLSYASEDYEIVKKVYTKLKSSGWSPWMDKVNLLGGQDWKSEISTAIEKSDIFIPFLSSVSVNKQGFFQKELRLGIERLDYIPEDSIYIIPVVIEKCKIPNRFRDLHYIEFTSMRDYKKISNSIISIISS